VVDKVRVSSWTFHTHIITLTHSWGVYYFDTQLGCLWPKSMSVFNRTRVLKMLPQGQVQCDKPIFCPIWNCVCVFRLKRVKFELFLHVSLRHLSECVLVFSEEFEDGSQLLLLNPTTQTQQHKQQSQTHTHTHTHTQRCLQPSSLTAQKRA